MKQIFNLKLVSIETEPIARAEYAFDAVITNEGGTVTGVEAGQVAVPLTLDLPAMLMQAGMTASQQ